MGTMIQGYQLDEPDYRGARFSDHPSPLKGANDLLTLTQPQIIQDIHEAYLQAGADIIETNTFNATSIGMADYNLESIVTELNFEAARIAQKAAQKFTTADKPRFVAGILGPTRTLHYQISQGPLFFGGSLGPPPALLCRISCRT